MPSFTGGDGSLPSAEYYDGDEYLDGKRILAF